MLFQAWEGGSAGASQREIAVALFGAARVAADWAAGITYASEWRGS